MSLTHEELLHLTKQHTDLGHEKQNDCVARQLEMILNSPGTSLPQAAGKGESSMANLASFYRFANNEKIPLDSLRQIRAQTVLDTVPDGGDIMVVHDMSPLDFSTQNAKMDRRLIGNHRGMGYEYVCCAALDPHSAAFLGVLHDTVINENGPDDTGVMNYDYERLFEGGSPDEQQALQENHRHQMAVHVNGLSSLLQNYHVIHVADREFDDIFVIDQCLMAHTDFVIRSMANRNVQVPHAEWIPPDAFPNQQAGHALQPGWVCVNLGRFVEAVPLQPYKNLPLDKRGRVTDPAHAARMAHLAIGSWPLCPYRPAKRNHRYFQLPHPIHLHLVVIRETDPPLGVEPLLWVLFTCLPVATWEQLRYIGRLYEFRWKIEDFFKLLKSGYGIEKHRFCNATKTAKLLVLLTMAAMTLFHLKEELGLPSGGYLDEQGYQKLKQASLDLHNPDLDLRWRFLAYIAKSGGWLGRRNDPLGPTILMRGLLQFLAVFDMLSQHQPLIHEALEHPEILRTLICV